MSDIESIDTNPRKSKQIATKGLSANKSLTLAAQFWFLVAVTGQLIFVYYIAAFYGGAAIAGDFAAWNKVLPRGYIAGETMGNLVLGSHLFLALIITLCGPLQLIPQIRARAPIFHRWNGRVYLLTVILAALGGVITGWTRGSIGSNIQHIGITINAVLILLFAYMALRYALARQFAIHRRWALRLFLVVSGVWFFRVGLMFWIIVNQGPVGFDPNTFEGPFLNFLSFAQYLIPLAVLQLYLYAKDRASTTGKYVMTATLVVLTLAMGVGIFGATMFLWLPRI
jgi:hypothetical protein